MENSINLSLFFFENIILYLVFIYVFIYFILKFNNKTIILYLRRKNNKNIVKQIIIKNKSISKIVSNENQYALFNWPKLKEKEK